MMAPRGQPFLEALRSILRWWEAPRGWRIWLLLALITGLILLINGLNVGIRFIARNIENALPCLALPCSGASA